VDDSLGRFKARILTVRPLAPSDSSKILEWRNSEVARRYSRNSRVISPREHEDWIKKNFNQDSKASKIYIFFEQQVPVGMTRIDLTGRSIGEISIVVDPKFYSRGYGSSMLKKTIELGVIESDLIKFIGVINDLNLASIALFTKNGFIKLDSVDGFSTYERSI
jgi:RimJ/RimL family protein N-acetyltransferase